MRLVNGLYSKSEDGEVPKRAMGDLVDYAEEFPKKLVQISALLRKRGVKDFVAGRTKYVKTCRHRRRHTCIYVHTHTHTYIHTYTYRRTHNKTYKHNDALDFFCMFGERTD